MAQRFFEEIAGKTGIFSPRPKCRSVWRDWAPALGIDPTRLAGLVAIQVLQNAKHGHVGQRFARLKARKHKLSKSRSAFRIAITGATAAPDGARSGFLISYQENDSGTLSNQSCYHKKNGSSLDIISRKKDNNISNLLTIAWTDASIYLAID
jgi:hypothetical protein